MHAPATAAGGAAGRSAQHTHLVDAHAFKHHLAGVQLEHGAARRTRGNRLLLLMLLSPQQLHGRSVWLVVVAAQRFAHPGHELSGSFE
jgi:uncharacterized protein (DUF952 family)